MYGNERLPGVAMSDAYRDNGSIWRGYPEATWFKTVEVVGSEATKLPRGTVLKEDISTGFYSPVAIADILSENVDLFKLRLAIVADDTALTGTAEVNSTVLVGIQGQIDKARVLIDGVAFTVLTDAQQIKLNTQLESWGFMLVNVMQG